MERKSSIDRKTKETMVKLKLNMDGKGESDVSTTIGFLDHVLESFARHGRFDLYIKASGDTDVESHHLVEDIGICLGDAVAEACGDKVGIRRFGNTAIPMDESLAAVIVDLCDRAFLVFNVSLEKQKVGSFDVELVKEFFHGFTNHCGATLHINLAYGSNTHHIIEAIFKAFGRALDQATSKDERIQGVLSTKGTL